MTGSPRQSRFQGLRAETRKLLAGHPDEDALVEFKSEVRPVNDELIAALANTAALRGVPTAHLLIGVSEETDETTGLRVAKVTGIPSKDLRDAKRRVHASQALVRPEPPSVEVLEENVGHRPILHARIGPSSLRADQKGRRARRVGEQTHAMTDDELLQLLDERHKGRYAPLLGEVAAQATSEFMVLQRAAYENLEEQLRRSQEEAADLASGEADLRHDLTERQVTEAVTGALSDLVGEVYDSVQSLDAALHELPGAIAGDYPASAVDVADRLFVARQSTAMWIVLHWDRLGDELTEAAQRVLAKRIDVWDYEANQAELAAFRALVAPRASDRSRSARNPPLGA